MDLILWRHAEAEEAGGAMADSKRRLTARGEKQARQVAGWLRKHLPRKRTILVSPAERTQQTANALELAYEIEPGLGIGATAEDLLALARWPARGGALLMIGHQPSLGQLAALLLAGGEAEWSVRKGAAWWFSSRERGGVRQTSLRAVIDPDLL